MTESAVVWVSRPAHRAAGLVRELTAAGLTPYLQPALNIEEIAVDADGGKLANAPYDIVVLISAEAARRFAAIRKTPFAALSVGGASAKAVRENSLAQLLVEPPAVADSEQLLELPVLQNDIEGKRVLVVGGETRSADPDRIYAAGGIAPLLCETLTSRGAAVQTLALYRRSMPMLNPNEKEELQKHAPQFKAAVAYSGETAANMLAMLGAETSQTPLFVIHPNIAAAAEKAGWQNVQLAPSDDAGMAQAIGGYLLK